jgi:hypothetical protein
MKPNPRIGEFTCERLKLAREQAGGTLAWSKVADIIQKSFEQEVACFCAINGAPRKPRAAPATPRKRDEHIDALVYACGGDPFQLTRAAIQAAAVAVAEIKQVSPDLSVDEIKRRVQRYKEKHRDWPLTPMAISKNWHDLGSSSGRTYSAANDPYLTPENWRERAKQVYPDADFEGKEWTDIGILIRTDILKKST